MSTKFIRTLLLGLVIVTLPACFMFRGGKTNLPASIEVIGTDYEEKLHELVGDSLTKLRRYDSTENAQLIFRKPYFYKEYIAYPDGIDDYSTEIRASESLTTPYTAQIRLKKKRFTTKFLKKKSNFDPDTIFYETLGTETLSYELRNGRWREVGTLFIAAKTDPRLKEAASKVRFEDSEVLDIEKKRWWQKLLFWRD